MKQISIFIIFIFLIVNSAYSKNQIDLLLEKLDSNADYKIKIASAIQLGKISNGSVAPHLASAYKKQKNKAVRLSIIQAISQIPDSQALAQLIYLKNSAFLNKNEKIIVAQTLWSFRNVIDEQSWVDHFQINSNSSKKLDALWVLSAIDSNFIKNNITDILSKSNQPSYTAGILDTFIYFSSPEYKKLCELYVNQQNSRLSLKAKMCLQSIKQPVQYKKQINQEILQTETFAFTSQYFESHNPSKKSSNLFNTPVLASLDKSAGLSQKNSKYTDIQFKGKQIYTEDFDPSSLEKLESYGGELELIRNTIKKNMHLFDSCYEILGNHNQVKGNLNMEFEVFSSGKMDNLKYLKNSINDKALQKCFANGMKKMHFDQINLKSIKVQYTFSFK
ncbi:MAG TPA: AgmX/PglI C-terminal domain-containing protein [Oligoflexia bacterium]|nr:AgmX/PglI C-terminal domain-containing protein [Oligoflexia bacterium]HMR23879.1 AgmX/PglI C-terminal domain-containing protein [Oligoflexia bacterium]